MNFVDILRKKRNGEKLSRGEIEYLIKEYTGDKIPDYQFSAFLMAVYLKGMDSDETADLTRAMLYSGKTLDLSAIKMPRIDKHSTGGVGDKISLILAPLVASCGICIPMISGRSLGHTGGTLDKLESIPGCKTALSIEQFKKQLKEIGVGIIGQTEDIVPADRKIYALRDVTATVESIPLISASIMSKKLAEDLDGLVLDVKFGNGAFMQDYDKAKQLAESLVQIGKRCGVTTVAILTDMNDPLGEYVGNALEILETLECLKGNGPADLMQITFALAEIMLEIARIKGGRELLIKKIRNGEALEKFRKMIEYQGGDYRVINDYAKLPIARGRRVFLSSRTGYVHSIDTFRLGMLVTKLGAGRLKKEDRIDHSCGFRILKKTGDEVRKGEPLVEIFSDDRGLSAEILKNMSDVFVIRKKLRRKKTLIRAMIY